MAERLGSDRNLISENELARALLTPDLTEDQYEGHSIEILYREVEATALEFGVDNTHIIRSLPVVPIEQHYDELGFDNDAGVRSSINSRYVDGRTMLRGQTAANIPPVLKEFAQSDQQEILVVSPGICFRSKKSDAQHASVIHQVDIWYVNKRQLTDKDSLLEMSELMATGIAQRVLPGFSLTNVSIKEPSQSHPYLLIGRKLKASDESNNNPATVMEYGVTNPDVLNRFGIPEGAGVSMGIILERSVMLRKKLPDVRLITSPDPNVQSQMWGLEIYKPVQYLHEYTRDISLNIPKELLSSLPGSIEKYIYDQFGITSSISAEAVSLFEDLPEHVRERNNLSPDHVNVLLRLIFSTTDPKTKAEINEIRNQILEIFNNAKS